MSGNPGNIVAGTTGGKGKGPDLDVRHANANEARTREIAFLSQTCPNGYFAEMQTDMVVNQWNGRTRLDPDQPPPGAGSTLEYPIDGEWRNEYIQNVSYLENYPSTNMARYLMKSICKVVFPFMERFGWTVDHVTEFYPQDANLLGLNVSAGRIIFVRLREHWDRDVFRSLEEITASMIHELCHNSHAEHNGDFYHLWNDLNIEAGLVGAAGGQPQLEAARRPRRRFPPGHISISSGGQRMLLTVADWHKHFSKYANIYVNRGAIFHIPRAFDPAVVLRLVQLAKGLDPADDKPLFQVQNYRDYWSDEHGELTIRDGFSLASLNPNDALALYLSMYKTGEIFGWHASSRDWLRGRLDILLRWAARLGPGPWAYNRLATAQSTTQELALVVQRIYNETTARDRPLRSVVVGVMKDVILTWQEDKRLAKTDPDRELIYDSHGIETITQSLQELVWDLREDASPAYRRPTNQ